MNPRKLVLTKEINGRLKQLYSEDKLNYRQVSRILGTSKKTLHRWLLESEIPIRSNLYRVTPTGPERLLIELINRNSLPYKYTGDGSFWIGGINPDFVNINGEKVAVEVFGDYWHSPAIARGKEKRTEEGRRKILREYGWSLTILWESEIGRLSDKELVDKLKEPVEY